VGKPDNKTYAQLVTRHEQFGIVLNPEILQLYKGISEALPVLIIQAIDGQLRREYKYALGGQIVAGLALVLLAGGFVFLVMNGHERPAYALLGAGVLNVIGGFLRARLSDAGEKHQRRKEQPDESK
jgi:hypothetical protein